MSKQHKYELLKELMITGYLDVNWSIKIFSDLIQNQNIENLK